MTYRSGFGRARNCDVSQLHPRPKSFRSATVPRHELRRDATEHALNVCRKVAALHVPPVRPAAIIQVARHGRLANHADGMAPNGP
jgi:hypothetical protein